MLKEVKIILENGTHKSKNGSVFENLIRLVLESHQYFVVQNVHDAGLEIDLFAQHKIKNEILYVECKAKEKPKSNEIKNFIFAMDYGVDEKNADYGYFIHTEELDRQAAALKIKLEREKNNLSFIGPNELIKILEDTGKIACYREESISIYAISKLILTYSPEGFHYILILQEGSIASHFSIFDAKSLGPASNQIHELLKDNIKEIHDLQKLDIKNISSQSKTPEHIDNERDIVIPIKESENWYDYTPASYEHFIGRQNLKKDLKVFLDRVRTGKTSKRIFFLDGKSGWGKSSLLAELKGSSSNLKYWKNRIFVLAVDTRSASSANYIGLAFKRLIDNAINEGFIRKNIFTQNVRISSPLDVLGNENTKELLKSLKKNKKLLVIVFDQFEDQFRKESLFDAFYKFCLDVEDLRENIVVGFSWKSEINIPLGNPAYHKFYQLKEFANQITIPEFTQNDAKQIIKQLEKTIKKPIGTDLENRLVESSQGFPWLIKKLCIHTYKQFTEGKSIEEIVEQELNYKELFENDLLNLSGEEKKALDYIAKRAYDGNHFEISEFDKIEQGVIDSLIHKRLLIRTGSSYNIYWDIFRDYIVTKEIPVLGESYLLRQNSKACLECFLTFKSSNMMSLNEIKTLYPRELSDNSVHNILLELRSIGLIKKSKEESIYSLTTKVEEVSEVFFRKYITQKFQNYRPYLELLKVDKAIIRIEDIVNVLKLIFRTESLEETTWYAYGKNLITWLELSNLDLKNKVVQIKNRKSHIFKANSSVIGKKINKTSDRPNIYIKDKYSQAPKYSPAQIIKSYEKFILDPNLVHAFKFRELVLLGLVNDNEDILMNLNSEGLQSYLAKEAVKFNPIEHTYQLLINNHSLSIVELSNEIPSFYKSNLSESSRIQLASILLSWAKFVFKISKGEKFDAHASRERSRSKYYLCFGPNHVVNTILKLNANKLDSSSSSIRKINELYFLGLLDLKDGDFVLNQKSYKIIKAEIPELELYNALKFNTHIQEFQNFYTEALDKELTKEEQISLSKNFFIGYSESSRRIKLAVYLNWIKFFLKVEKTLLPAGMSL